ncbi:hypothetical protein [Salinisphaera sp. LB1]|uniref:hypothetical protein n=1 Tax=Salinisphaera sp. LB1 TaxID=2183911 RepID=UPI0013149EA9|nr:hypothetical protein [Salinisphaera sp. LB1]
MVSRFCFDTTMIGNRMARIRRSHGVNLPVHAGIRGLLGRRKRLNIGLGASTRFLKKNSRLMGRFAEPSWLNSDTRVDDMTPKRGNTELGIAGWSINYVQSGRGAESWRHVRMSRLDVQWPDTGNVGGSSTPNYYQCNYSNQKRK